MYQHQRSESLVYTAAKHVAIGPRFEPGKGRRSEAGDPRLPTENLRQPYTNISHLVQVDQIDHDLDHLIPHLPL